MELALLPPVMHVHNVQNKEHEDVAAHTSGHPGILQKPQEVLLTHFGVNLYKRQIRFA